LPGDSERLSLAALKVFFASSLSIPFGIQAVSLHTSFARGAFDPGIPKEQQCIQIALIEELVATPPRGAELGCL
jgi:hypothetical protein